MTPTEDKELIERLVAEAQSQRIGDVEQAKYIISRYLAERGKEAVAWLNTRYETLHHANRVDTCDDVSELAPLFLAPCGSVCDKCARLKTHNARSEARPACGTSRSTEELGLTGTTEEE